MTNSTPRLLSVCFIFPLIVGVGAFYLQRKVVKIEESLRDSSVPMEQLGIDGLKVERRTVDVGNVDVHGSQKFEYLLVNEGSQPIDIMSIEKTGDCTIITNDRSRIYPNSSLRIPVEIDLSRINKGEFTREVRFHLGADHQGKSFSLFFKGVVDDGRQLVMLPSVIDFGKIESSSKYKRVVYIKGSSGAVSEIPEILNLTELSGTYEIILGTEGKETTQRWKQMTISIDKPTKLKSGPFEKQITFRNSTGKEEKLPIIGEIVQK